MIKIEKTVTPSAEQWDAIIRGARNAMNSWDRMDSGVGCEDEGCLCKDCSCSRYPGDCAGHFILGHNDHDLLMRLARAGTTHAKYRRMIQVYADISAPIYWFAEMDTYKVGTVRNSCSFMHKGVSKPFEITDFSVKDSRIYEILSPLPKKTHTLSYPYETDEYRPYTDHNGRTYRVYRNGKVIREAFTYVDTWGTGRTRTYSEDDAVLYQTRLGYYGVKLSGRNGGHMLLHRLVATVWCERPEGTTQVNHIDGDKGNNCAENLEWVTASDNMQKAVAGGLCDELDGLHRKYRTWKNGVSIIPVQERILFRQDCESGLSHKELAEKWNITPNQANNVRYVITHSEYEDLFQECYTWENILDTLNYYRSLYLETKDEQIFQEIRSNLPQGYIQKSTMLLNYEVLRNIYTTRKNHRLDEWREFCAWIETLPYSEFITLEEKDG